MVYEVTDADGRLIARRITQLEALDVAFRLSLISATAVLVLCWHVGVGSHLVASLVAGVLQPITNN